MKLGVYLLLVLTFAACSHTPVSTDRDPQSVKTTEPEKDKRVTDLRNQAHYFYKRGDYLRSIPYFELMLNLGEASLDSADKFILGYSYLTIGEGLKAEETIRGGIKLSPYQPVGYQLLGLASLSQGKPAIAIEHFQRGLEFDSHPPKIHYYLGLAYERLGKPKERDKEFQKAEDEYEKVLLQNAYDFGANFELAYLYLTLGHNITKVDELIANARTGLKDPDPELVEGGTLYVQFYLPLLEGMEAYRKNDVKKAAALLSQAALSSPFGAKADLAEIYNYLSANEKEAGRLESSNSFLEISKELDPFGIAPRK